MWEECTHIGPEFFCIIDWFPTAPPRSEGEVGDGGGGGGYAYFHQVPLLYAVMPADVKGLLLIFLRSYFCSKKKHDARSDIVSGHVLAKTCSHRLQNRMCNIEEGRLWDQTVNPTGKCSSLERA